MRVCTKLTPLLFGAVTAESSINLAAISIPSIFRFSFLNVYKRGSSAYTPQGLKGFKA
jgi:hypothetical protein